MNTIDEDLTEIRALADEHRAELKVWFRQHAKDEWRSLGMQRPADRQDWQEATAAWKRIKAAFISAFRPFQKLVQQEPRRSDFMLMPPAEGDDA